MNTNEQTICQARGTWTDFYRKVKFTKRGGILAQLVGKLPPAVVYYCNFILYLFMDLLYSMALNPKLKERNYGRTYVVFYAVHQLWICGSVHPCGEHSAVTVNTVLRKMSEENIKLLCLRLTNHFSFHYFRIRASFKRYLHS